VGASQLLAQLVNLFAQLTVPDMSRLKAPDEAGMAGALLSGDVQ